MKVNFFVWMNLFERRDALYHKIKKHQNYFLLTLIINNIGTQKTFTMFFDVLLVSLTILLLGCLKKAISIPNFFKSFFFIKKIYIKIWMLKCNFKLFFIKKCYFKITFIVFYQNFFSNE